MVSHTNSLTLAASYSSHHLCLSYPLCMYISCHSPASLSSLSSQPSLYLSFFIILIFISPSLPLSLSLPFRDNEGNEALSAAVQLHDGLVRGWALWGEYLQSLFELDSNMTLGHSVLTCYLHACRTQKEAKCRKFLAHIIWLLTHDDAKGSMAEVRGHLKAVPW